MPLAVAWRRECGSLEGVEMHFGSIFDVQCDALVSPANSFGFMDGGIDALYTDRFGWEVQARLQRRIASRHHGELLVGAAEIIETGHPPTPFLIAAPTMRVPMVLGSRTVNPYLATRAVLLLVEHGSFSDGSRIADRVCSIAFPGMGTGVGRVPAAVCARQMRKAIEELRSGFTFPDSWAEASERHQLLYTSRPKRLQ
jgi:O-acetyl-ADP-ribose deacetylase (regulator of RNase III)